MIIVTALKLKIILFCQCLAGWVLFAHQIRALHAWVFRGQTFAENIGKGIVKEAASTRP
jgi:hypothetical protein